MAIKPLINNPKNININANKTALLEQPTQRCCCNEKVFDKAYAMKKPVIATTAKAILPRIDAKITEINKGFLNRLFIVSTITLPTNPETIKPLT